jgi:hypothetical protein
MDENETTITIPQQRDVLLTAKRDGLEEVIVVNEALLGFAHSTIFPWYLCVTLEAKELIANGMPSPVESELLFDIADEIEASVLGGKTGNGAGNALFLARSTWNGIRQLLYYVHDPEIAHPALQTLLVSRKWEREWGYFMKNDPIWEKASYVFQLFPKRCGSSS